MEQEIKNQISQEVQEEINNIGRLINEAKDGVIGLVEDLADELREFAFSDGDVGIVKDCEIIEPLEDLCIELGIDIPLTGAVCLRDDYNYGVEYEGYFIFVAANMELVISFMDGWIQSCANSVIQQAQERIGNLLETGC